MREIKYKAWSKSKKTMFDYHEIKSAGDWLSKLAKVLGFRKMPGGLFLAIDDDDLIFLEYTGIKLNNEEIYEGDIYEYYLDTENGRKKFTEVVTFKDGAFWVGDYLLCDAIKADIEPRKIGNVYEHPHLLEGNN